MASRSLLPGADRPRIAGLSDQWAAQNRAAYALLGNRVAAALFFASIPLDLPFHPSLRAALPYMLGHLGVSLFCLAVAVAVGRYPKDALPRGLGFAAIVAPGVAQSLMHSLFALVCEDYALRAVVFGQLLTVIFGTVFIHRFWKEQYAFNAIAALGALAAAAARPALAPDTAMILVADALAFATMFVYRREFFGSLFERFQKLSGVMPRRVARFLTVSPRELGDEFAPRERYTVCVCSDWRGFQELTRRLGPEGTAAMLESYYDIVFTHLDALGEDCEFFVDWTADELFVVFFGDEPAAAAVEDLAFRFVHALATTIFRETRADAPVIYDIGVSAGPGLIGLLGPRRMKKATNIGFTAGAAKRFESEAKAVRARQPGIGLSPLVLFPEELRAAVERSGLYGGEPAARLTAKSKDIEGRAVCLWQQPPQPSHQPLDFMEKLSG